MAQIADIIKYEGDNSTFIWKHPSEDFNNLKEVYLPESLSEIFFDTFFGCYRLECNDFSSELEALIAEKRSYRHGDVIVINYDGTKAQWQAVRKYCVFSYGSAAAIVAKCKDGETV